MHLIHKCSTEHKAPVRELSEHTDEVPCKAGLLTEALRAPIA